VGVFEKTSSFPRSTLSYPDYLDWKRLTTTFSSFDAFKPQGFTLTGDGDAQAIPGARVTGGFFRTLGISPILGRDFAPGEDLPSGPHVALISYGAWQNRFNSDPHVIGRAVMLDGESTTIIGVLPRTFHFSPIEPVDVFKALHPFGECDVRRSCHAMYGIARLKDGIAIQAADADVASVAAQLERQYPENKDQGGTVLALSDLIGGNLRPILFVLLGGALLLLLIASVNVASLLLMRSESRRREIAVRNALGASTARLVTQFAIEGVVLVTLGTAFGLASASVTMRLLTALIPAAMYARLTFLHDLGLNLRILSFAGLVAACATVLFSITPAVRLARVDMREGLSEGSRGSAGRGWRRLGARLVVVELATAMVLLVGAGLLGKSLYHLLHVEIGFQPDRLALLQIAAPGATYGTPERQVLLQRQLLERVAALPGVESAAAAETLPIGSNGNTTWFRIMGKPWHGEHNDTPQREVTPRYFHTIGATLLRGRLFEESDDAAKPLVIVVNQAFAKQYFPGEDPLGREITPLGPTPTPTRIVGIVADIREGPLDAPIPPVIYVPFNQSPDRVFSLVVRSSLDERSLLPALAATVRQLDPGIITRGQTTMSSRIDESAYLHRSSAWLVGGFAGSAFVLSLIGLYGVIAYSVSHRNREIGVRMALGAHRGTVYRLVLTEAGRLTLAGIAIGTTVAIGTASLMRDLLFGVQSWDVPTLTLVAVLLASSALLASYLPARLAASVNPVEALRAE
jgi:macrolide transport system ATP-binding/permease protein